jgi:hypothetical protein
MKVWYGHASEHSMNLVMIGNFKNARDASTAKEIIEWLTKQVETDDKAGLMESGGRTDHFTDGMLDLLRKVSIHSLGPAEMEQFSYDVTVKVDDEKLIMTTDEVDVSAFLKVLLDKGARVEVYSAHDYPGPSAATEASQP